MRLYVHVLFMSTYRRRFQHASQYGVTTYALLRTKRLKLEQVIIACGHVGGSFRHARETRLR